MGRLQRLGADPMCNIVAFALGADIVALLTTSRLVRATLAGPVARTHFQAMSVARWGEGCRCHYTTARVTNTPQEGSNGVGGGSINDVANDAGTVEKASRNTSRSGENCTKEQDADWLAFYLRRVGHRVVRPSPLNLLQEHYTEDAYRLLSCCILCSRTSGGDTVKDAVAAFFKACPTPSRVLSADQEELRKTLLPLGLNREVTIKSFADGFLASAWHDPSELHGCGRFASDSWQIFCLGTYRPGDQVVAVAAAAAQGGEPAKKKKSGSGGRRGSLDRNLSAYCRFAGRSAANKGEEGGGAPAGREDESTGVGKGKGKGKGHAGARKTAATIALGGKKEKKRNRTAVPREVEEDGSASMAPKRRNCLEVDESAARRPRGSRAEGSRRGGSSVPAGTSSRARRSKAAGGSARGVAVGVASRREERALRRGRRS